MKKIVLILALLLSYTAVAQKPKAEALRFVKLTTAERDLLTPEANNVWFIYNETTSQFEFYNGTAWVSATSVGLPSNLAVTDADNNLVKQTIENSVQNTNVLTLVQNATSISSDSYTLDVNSSSHVSNMTAAGAFRVKVNSGDAYKINGLGFNTWANGGEFGGDLTINKSTGESRVFIQKDDNLSTGFYLGYTSELNNNWGLYGYENSNFSISTNGVQALKIDNSQHTYFSGNIQTLGSFYSRSPFLMYDNRDNAILISSDDATTVNRDLKFGNGTYTSYTFDNGDIIGEGANFNGNVTANNFIGAHSGNFIAPIYSDFNSINDTRFFKGVNSGLLNGLPDSNTFNIGLSLMYNEGANPSGWQIASTRGAGSKIYYRSISNNSYYSWRALASEDWVLDNFSELVGDNVAYTNVNNNFSVGQSINGNLDVTGSGTFTGTVSGLDAVNNDDFVTLSQLNASSGATPAITSDGTTPSLNTGITAGEVRSLIGAGTMSNWGVDVNGSPVAAITSGERIDFEAGTGINIVHSNVGTDSKITISAIGGGASGYTSTDFNTDFSLKSTSDLSEGTNLYYTTARANTAIDNRVTKTFVDNLSVDYNSLSNLPASSGFTITDITGQTAATQPIDNLDELVYSDAGVLKKLTIQDLENYMQTNLTLGSSYTAGTNLSLVGSEFSVVNNPTFIGDVTASNFILSSDKRLKRKISTIDNKPLDVNFKKYVFKNDKKQVRYGVIAQELEKKHPEFVKTDSNGFKSVMYIDLLVAKIAELEREIEKLKAKK